MRHIIEAAARTAAAEEQGALHWSLGNAAVQPGDATHCVHGHAAKENGLPIQGLGPQEASLRSELRSLSGSRY